MPAGTFEVVVTGSRSFTRTGKAVVTDLGGGMFTILMGTNPRVQGVDTISALDLQAPPAQGARPITSFEPGSPTAAGLLFTTPGGSTHRFTSTANSGTLTFTRVNAGAVEGEFTVDLEGGVFGVGPPDPLEHLHLAGRFHATY